MTDHPTLPEQIDAVQWAWSYAKEKGWRKGGKLTPSQIKDLIRRLEAAIETLRTLEYGSEIAR